MFMDQLWMRSLPTQHLDQPVPNEALNLLNVITITAATASVADTTSFLRTNFNTFLIIFENLINNTNNRQPRVEVQVGGTFQTTTYLGAISINTGGTLTAITGTIPPTLGPLAANAAPGASGFFFISNPAQTATTKMLWGRSAAANTTPVAVSYAWSSQYTGSAGAVTGFQIDMSGGNIRSGIIRVYGIGARP